MPTLPDLLWWTWYGIGIAGVPVLIHEILFPHNRNETDDDRAQQH